MAAIETTPTYVALTHELLEKFITKGYHYFRCCELNEEREKQHTFYNFEIGFYKTEKEARTQQGKQAFFAAHVTQEPAKTAEYEGQCRFWVKDETAD